ncbi:polysaccharide deacetylase family protein [Pusillimonas minor]|uniref:Polysaccharide deacetylase family protein n=1 Tax=Pusillimonas minor TaxID=2697024 RepID=A0A842HRG4_9BURK|nr:polysaccharide deacetylase family protein [Pusillimonas minor]MBC2770853.1 polysaccharide deacetylase family protein [Pusillimonas minor]
MSARHAVPVLMYHHVTPAGGVINATPGHFESQLQWLKSHGYRSLTSDQFAAHLHGDAAPAKSVLITFDDGYLDNFIHAYPLLKKYGFNALIFLVTSWMQDGASRPLTGTTAPLTPDHAKCMTLVSNAAFDDVALRWSEVERMANDGVCEFHSHTHTHTRWDKVDPVNKNARMASELADSRATLLSRLGSVSAHFCWPQGYFDADYRQIALEAGFRYLYTTHAFGMNVPGTDPAHIYRFAVRDTHGASVGRRLVVAGHPVIGPMFNRWKLWKRSRRQS